MFQRPIGGRSLVVTGMVLVAVLMAALATLVLWLVWPPLARAFLVLTILALGWAYAVEPYWVEYRDLEVGIPDLPAAWEGLRIAHVSDFHLGFSPGPGFMRRVLDEVKARKPDLIAHTGDFFSGQSTGVPKGAELLAGLQADLGVYGVLGNHDYFADTDALLGVLDAARVRLLRNGALPLERDGSRLWVAGVDDLSTGHDDLEATLREVPPGEPTLLLSHSPDLIEEASDRAVSLMLSGHTHGGQVCLPFLGPVFCFSRFYKRYASGRFQVGPTTLYVNRGLGNALLPFRFLCRPEVTFFTLRRS